MSLLVTLGVFIYCSIGIIVNGILNEDLQKFSFILMFFWPLALALILIFWIIGKLLRIGELIKERLSER